ncbi:MAG: PQQ-binding-like beta-propeller repeat protein [Pirellulaceae bacterium]
MNSILRILIIAVLFFSASIVSAADWPQAAGPNGDFAVNGEGPSEFSVTHDQNIRWRVALPNTGQGTPIVKNGRVFVLSHAPVKQDTELGSLTVGQCFDSASGKELWRKDIVGNRVTDLSSLFSDNTAASAVATDDLVAFVNVGGQIAVFDHDGQLQWNHHWVPFGRHHARQHEPMLHGQNVIVLKTIKKGLPQTATTKAGAKEYGRSKDVWTHLHAFDMQDGSVNWIAEPGTGVHSTSILQSIGGEAVIATSRGGGHQPPEEPYGVSLIDAETGHAIWDVGIAGYQAHQNVVFNEDGVHVIKGFEHLLLSLKDGQAVQSPVSLAKDVTISSVNRSQYQTKHNQMFESPRKPITYQTNIVLGDYTLFLSHKPGFIGRINVRTGDVEYLQVPIQVVRQANVPDEILWNEARRNDMKNSSGFVASQDKRNSGSGWGHVSAPSPIAIGDKVYFPTMIGIVYVLKWDADVFDKDALLSISDLGPATETWTLSSLSFANGRIYARTLKELICIESRSD